MKDLSFYIAIANVFAFWIFLMEDGGIRNCLYMIALLGLSILFLFIYPTMAVIPIAGFILGIIVLIRKPERFNIGVAFFFLLMFQGAQIEYLQTGNKEKVALMVVGGFIALAKILGDYMYSRKKEV